MRITNNTTADQVIAGIQSNLSRVSDLSLQLSSGKKYQKASDNPADMARIMRLQQQMNKDDQYQKNLDNLKPNLQMTDSTLSDIVTSMQNIMQITKTYENTAVQSSNSQLLATNIDSIRANIIDRANASYNGRFIFGGYNTTTKPFELLSDGRIKYHGTDDTLTAQITDTANIDLSVKGNDLFVTHSVLGNAGMGSTTLPIAGLTTNSFTIKVGSDAPIAITVGTGTADVSLQGVVDAINNSGVAAHAYIKDTPQGARLKIVSSYVGSDGTMTLSDAASGGVLEHLGVLDNGGAIVGAQSDVKAGLLDKLTAVSNKMKAGTTDISSEVADINTAYQNVLKNQGQVGVLTQNADNHASMMTDMGIKRQELLASIWNVDMVEVASSLSRESSAYQASIQAGAKIIMPTLLDYMK